MGLSALRRLLVSNPVVGRLATGAATALIIRMLGMGLALALNIVLARAMADADYGIYVFALTFGPTLAILGEAGMPQAALRFLPEYATTRSSEHSAQFIRYARGCVLRISLALVVVGWSTYLVWKTWLDPNVAISAWNGLAFVPAIALCHLYQESLRSYKRIVLSQAFEQLLIPLVLLGTALLAIWFDSRLSPFTLLPLHLVLYVLVAGMLYLVTKRTTRAVLTDGRGTDGRGSDGAIVGGAIVGGAAMPTYAATDLEARRRWRAVAIPLTISGITSVILTRCDVLFVGAMMSSTEVAYYSAAAKLAFVLNLGMWSLNAIATPFFAEAYHKQDFRHLQKIVSYVTCIALAVTLIPASIFWLEGHWVLSLFGPQYPQVFPILICLSIAHLLNVACGPLGPLMMTTGGHREYAYTMGTICIINVIATPLAIMTHGMMGAAVVYLVTMVLWNLILTYQVHRRLGIVTYPSMKHLFAK